MTFRRPFALSGVEGVSTYTAETVEALLETLSALAYRRAATLIHVTAAPGVVQALPISPEKLDEALAPGAM